MTSSRSTTAEPVRGSREFVRSRSTTSVRRSTWVRAMFASSLTVSGSSVTEISSIRGQLRRCPASWCGMAARRWASASGDGVGRGVQDVGDPVQFGHSVPLVARAGVPGAEAFGGLGEVGER
ncbi:hypothetical protein SMICM17S_10401 [Streptomyces microflavus]